MSRTLSTHISLWDETGELVTLAPGADLPGWAEGRVGEHCLVPSPDSDAGQDPAADADADAEAEADTEADADREDEADADSATEDADGEAPATTDAAPDFTAAAPRRGRSRK